MAIFRPNNILAIFSYYLRFSQMYRNPIKILKKKIENLNQTKFLNYLKLDLYNPKYEKFQNIFFTVTLPYHFNLKKIKTF